MDAIRAISKGIAGVAEGTSGIAFQAGGCNDPESIEYEAWMFQPDNEECAYYVTNEQFVADATQPWGKPA